MQNADMRGVRVPGCFAGDGATGVVVLFEENRVWCRDEQAKPTAFDQSTCYKQSWRELAPHDLAGLDRFSIANRFSVSEPTDVAPKRDACAIWLDFIKVRSEVCVGHVNRN